MTTNVGCCRELIEGADDGFGSAGYCVPVMHQGELAEAMIALCRDEDMRRRMGENGKKRVQALYRHEQMITNYLQHLPNRNRFGAREAGRLNGRNRV